MPDEISTEDIQAARDKEFEELYLKMVELMGYNNPSQSVYLWIPDAPMKCISMPASSDSDADIGHLYIELSRWFAIHASRRFKAHDKKMMSEKVKED